MGGVILALHAIGFLLALAALPGHYKIGTKAVFGLGTAVLAYTLGMRHAFDADHISAIDNVTRKLVNDKKRPLAVGFFFSLGHSSIVFTLAVLLSAGIRVLASQVKDDNSTLHHVTGIVGTTVSGTFLLIIAAINTAILVSIVQVFREARRGLFKEEELEEQLNKRGFLMRFLGPIARNVDSSWKMYPVGVLFGLGFDTATEVALLVLAGSATTAGLPFWVVLSLPILFAAGMSLFDTLDGCFMNFAYGWAFMKPLRKVYYNITITALSVAVAVFIGGVELLGLLAQELNLNGGFWSFLQGFDINKAGYVVVGMFVVTWAVALLVWKLARFEERYPSFGSPGGEPLTASK
jgi:high-affinity nickel-transport protein